MHGQKHLPFRNYKTCAPDITELEGGTFGPCLGDDIDRSLVCKARGPHLQSAASKTVLNLLNCPPYGIMLNLDAKRFPVARQTY
jgi:hypothetical protein